MDPELRMGESPVILSEAKDHRSQASVCPLRQTLRFAQGDNGGADVSRPPPSDLPSPDDPQIRSSLFKAIIGHVPFPPAPSILHLPPWDE